MPYEPNLVVNGDGTSSGNWTLSNASIIQGGTTHGKYFLMSSTSQMKQVVPLLINDINTTNREYRFSASYMFTSVRDVNDMNTKTYARIEMKYYDGTVDNFLFPFVETFTPETLQEGVWYNVIYSAYAKQNAVLTGINLFILSKGIAGSLGVDNLVLQRYITDLEVHDSNPHPHELPLAISVGSWGIKATKGDNVQFWLHDTGDAEFAGQLKAASGTFAGALQAASGTFTGTLSAVDGTFRGNLQAAGGTFSGALQAATGTFSGALQAASGSFRGDISGATGTFAGTVKAQNIDTSTAKILSAQIEQLVVGANVIMGPNATLSWSNVNSKPTDAQFGQMGVTQWRSTYIDANNVYTGNVYAQNLNTQYAKIQTAQIVDLVVGGNVTMGPNASISWGNVNSKPTNAQFGQMGVDTWKSTYIDGNNVYTGNVYANKINAYYGKITTAQIENLTVGTNVTMGANAYISWNQVTSQPSIPKTAADVGAVPTNTPKLTYIDQNGIYTGTLTADQIKAGSISADRISGGSITSSTIRTNQNAYIGNKLYINGNSFNSGVVWAYDFGGGATYAEIYSDPAGKNLVMYGSGATTLGASGSNTYLNGNVTVNGASLITSSNISSYVPAAKFG